MTSPRNLRQVIALFFAVSAMLLLHACSKESSGTAAPAERPAVAVEVVKVAPGDLQEEIAVVGTLAPKFQGEVKAEYSGTITDVFVSEWVKVQKGTLLARFDRREIEAGVKAAHAATMQAGVAATHARRELERTEKLRAAGLATQQNLDDARSAAEAAEAQLNASRAQEEMARTRLSKADVRATMSGVIASRSVNPGDFVENMGSPSPMFTIVDNRRLELTASVPSSRISRVTLGQPLTFTSDAVPGRTFSGRVSFINPAADQSSRTVKVIALVDNPDGALKSGLFVRGTIVTGQRRGVLRVPRSAIVSSDPEANSAVIFVVDGEKARTRTVSTGSASGQDIEVVSGVGIGDSVVTRGGFNLRDGDRVTVAPNTGA